ncbi:SRPBCC domain-containing protein [Pontibacter sp. HSC-14F20]|uniref:SRPBCC domain-containing protein n=1 Tax=Pontibacter sp. HSC-14F20 TaxID=2864136 RepID=UPI001C72BCFE|nr:SRPBCC domain-containing protein [Pontibacter sp. HSC-14F20]MBX0334458.1 SRPBCC domain-containing protein [Pontibacter sp. HSC-14F20]
MMDLIAKATIQIQKPVDEVFEGIVNPEKMTNYFISESSGRMETGAELTWQFPEFPDAFAVKVIKAEANRLVSFNWDEESTVNIVLEAQPDQSTVVSVTEGGKPYNEENLKWLIGNTEGWANFLACMKAYLEYGIQLRKGAFDFMRKK